MTVTFETLAAIYRLAYHLCNVDGVMKDEEIQTMVEFYAKFNIDMDTFKKLVNLGESMGDREAISLVAEMDAESKQKVANLFAKVVCSDQELTEEEKSMYFQISEYCGLPDPQSDDEQEEPEEQPEEEPADEDDSIAPAYLIANYYGIVSVRQSENTDWNKLSPELKDWLGCEGRVEIVRFTKALNAISEKLRLNKRHLVYMLGTNYGDKTVGDNMTATILYGGGYPIYGNIAFALETDGSYEIEGFMSKKLLNEVFETVNEAVDGLLRVK